MSAEYQQLSEEATHTLASEKPGILNADAKMVGFTWLTFFLLLVILYKFAFKPILAALDAREESIGRSVKEAQRIKEELVAIEEKRNEIMRQAQFESKRIIDDSRKAAVEAAKTITHKAREDSQILLENAKREIDEIRDSVQSQLKEQSIRIAVELASKLIAENLDEEKNKNLINRYIGKI